MEPPDRPDEDPIGGGGPPTGPDPSMWFGRTEGGIGFAPLTWQGRASIFLYVFLVVVALVTYSALTVTAFVILFYSVVFGSVLVVKSDLMRHWPPGS